MKYEIVDKIQAFKDYIDKEIENEDIEVVNFEAGEIWEMCDLTVSDLDEEHIIFIKKIK